MEVFDLPLDEFQAMLPELAQMGYDTDELTRMYRAQNSPMAPVNAAAAASAQEIADAGRRPVAGGLFSKEAGTTGWDALSSLNFEGWNGLTQAGAGIGQAIDAPMAAAQGLIPQGDMALEALGTAGAAMTGGGAAVVPRGSLRAGLARNAAGTEGEQMARRILDMRAAGRAGEVTDDMMAQADPQVMFNETPLPMDVDSRDARRLAAGFNTGAFHGGRGGYDRLDPEMAEGKTYDTGTWAADDPDISATYNGSVFDGTQATYPLRLRTQNYGVTDWENNAWGDGNPQARMLNPNEPRSQKFGDIYEDWQSWASTDNAARAANEQGLDGLRINNVVDIGPNIFSRANKTRPLPETGTSFSITNPTTARSDFARFDPEFAHLSNLSAANADYLTGLVASGASDDEVQAAYQMILDLEGPR